MRNVVTLLLLFPFLIAAQNSVVPISYGNLPQQTLDLYLPKENLNKVPVLIMLHGGAWSIGGPEYTSKHSQDLCNLGLIVANVDYQYVSEGVSADELLKDIDAAINRVKILSGKYGYSTDGYHLAGVSAGAHLALLYGYTSRNFKSISALCAPSRLDNPELLEFMKSPQHLKIVEYLAGAKFVVGGENLKFKSISPFFNITKIPTLLIHGTADSLVNFKLSESLFAELQRQGVDSKLVVREGFGHDVGMNSPDTEMRNLNDVLSWIVQHN